MLMGRSQFLVDLVTNSSKMKNWKMFAGECRYIYFYFIIFRNDDQPTEKIVEIATIEKNADDTKL